MRKASNIKQEPMTDHRNTESPDRQSEAFMQAVEKGDTHRIEEPLLQEEEDRFEDELRALWNEAPPGTSKPTKSKMHSAPSSVACARCTT